MHEILYVQKCLQLIEAKLNWGGRHTWVYEDFKRLQDLIFESSSISLSIHTLERLFGKLKTHKNYNPQAETKNALAVFLGYKNWVHFREQNPIAQEELHPLYQNQITEEAKGPSFRFSHDSLPLQQEVNNKGIPEEHADATDSYKFVPAPSAVKPVKQPFKKIAFFSGLFLVVALGMFFYFYNKTISADDIWFKAQNIYGKKPHTVKFTYRIPEQLTQDVYADFGTTDPFWKIDKKERSFYKTYLSPGVFLVKLKTQDTTLARTKVFIDSEGWMGFKYDIYEDIKTRTPLPKNLLISDGRLYTAPDKINPNLKGRRYYFEYATIKDFRVSGDHLIFDTRFRSNAEHGSELCNDMWFKLIGTQGELKIHFLVPGCFGFVQMIFGEKKLDGHAKDLSAFAKDFSDWKNARLEVVDKKVYIYFEDKLIFKTAYNQSVGNIMGIAITSKGAGETDFVKLYDANKQLVFSDDFE